MEHDDSGISPFILFANERYNDAFTDLTFLANDGDIHAHECLGFMYQCGMGVNRDITKSLRHLHFAAEAGSGIAAHNLGTLYQTCAPDIPIDLKKSAYWYERARLAGFNPSESSDEPA